METLQKRIKIEGDGITCYLRKGDFALRIQRTNKGTYIEAIRYLGPLGNQGEYIEYLWSPMKRGMPRIFKLTGHFADTKVPLTEVIKRQNKYPDKTKVRLK